MYAVTVDQAAALLKCSRCTVIEMISGDKLQWDSQDGKTMVLLPDTYRPTEAPEVELVEVVLEPQPLQGSKEQATRQASKRKPSKPKATSTRSLRKFFGTSMLDKKKTRKKPAREKADHRPRPKDWLAPKAEDDAKPVQQQDAGQDSEDYFEEWEMKPTPRGAPDFPWKPPKIVSVQVAIYHFPGPPMRVAIPDGWVSLTEAAGLLNVSIQNVKQRIAANRLVSQEWNGQILVSRQSIRTHMDGVGFEGVV